MSPDFQLKVLYHNKDCKRLSIHEVNDLDGIVKDFKLYPTFYVKKVPNTIVSEITALIRIIILSYVHKICYNLMFERSGGTKYPIIFCPGPRKWF